MVQTNIPKSPNYRTQKLVVYIKCILRISVKFVFLRMTKKYHGGAMRKFYGLTKSLIFQKDSDDDDDDELINDFALNYLTIFLVFC